MLKHTMFRGLTVMVVGAAIGLVAQTQRAYAGCYTMEFCDSRDYCSTLNYSCEAADNAAIDPFSSVSKGAKVIPGSMCGRKVIKVNGVCSQKTSENCGQSSAMNSCG